METRLLSYLSSVSQVDVINSLATNQMLEQVILGKSLDGIAVVLERLIIHEDHDWFGFHFAQVILDTKKTPNSETKQGRWC